MTNSVVLPSREGIRICDLSAVFPTSGADGMQLYALPRWHPVRWVFIKRALLLINLLKESPRPTRLMEMGFGCGILVPELIASCEKYVGIDIHSHVDEIKAALAAQLGPVDLRFGDARSLPFENGELDCIFSMSVLEHIADIDLAISEIVRVLKPGGRLVAGFPIENLVSNAFLDLIKKMIGFDRRIHHPTNHTQILSALRRYLSPVTERPFPISSSTNFSLYYAGIWRKLDG